jgi:simple sugar transport system permease protein
VSPFEGAVIAAALAAGPLLFAALGALLTEKVGISFIGIEGAMLVGAAAGYMAAQKSGDPALGLLVGAASGAVFAFVLVGVPVVLFQLDQSAVGFAAWFTGTGLSGVVALSYTGTEGVHNIGKVDVPLLSSIPWIGKALFDQVWPVYVAIALYLGVAWMLARTRHGLNVRAIGLDADSARAAGVSVTRLSLVYVALGGALIGIGGALLSTVIVQDWQTEMTQFRGFIALALVLFVRARPFPLLAATYFFGILLALGDIGQVNGWPITAQFLNMIPYLFALPFLAVRGWQRLRRPTDTSPIERRAAHATT